MNKAKKNWSARNLQGKGGRGFELLIGRAHLTRREKWEIKAEKRGARKQRPRIKYPLGVPYGRCQNIGMINPVLKGKRNKEWLNTVLSGPKN
jgi:hypothetical protein